MSTILQELLERNGMTIPQILVGWLCKPEQMRELCSIYKALEEGRQVGKNPDQLRELSDKALIIRLGLGFAEQTELPL